MRVAGIGRESLGLIPHPRNPATNSSHCDASFGGRRALYAWGYPRPQTTLPPPTKGVPMSGFGVVRKLIRCAATSIFACALAPGCTPMQSKPSSDLQTQDWQIGDNCTLVWQGTTI